MACGAVATGTGYARGGISAANAGAANPIKAAPPSRNFFIPGFLVLFTSTSIKQDGVNLVASRQCRTCDGYLTVWRAPRVSQFRRRSDWLYRLRPGCEAQGRPFGGGISW